MNLYNIQMVSKLTGISIHTLRAWEKRYQAVVPERDSSGRRTYNDGELDKLKMLGKICSLGGSIGNIANLQMSELKDLMSKFETSTPYNEPTPFTPIVEEEVDTQAILNHLLLALQDFKLDIISHELHKLKITMSLKDLAFKILLPLLQEIGFRVYNNTLNVAQEHAISSIVRFHIGQFVYQNYERKRKKGTVVTLATPEGEYHEFGILIASLLCIHHGINFYFLGANMPSLGFAEASKSLDSNILILGTTKASKFDTPNVLDDYIRSLLGQMDEKQMLLLGGDGNFSLTKFIKDPKFNFISTFQHLDSYLKQLK
jgi:MerR family transcriptional regulator, light-induced transcriptional regulator